ncbi:hypothetical protein [Nostoc favosum]|uniref:Transposase n=1 Tax=Nostoc favosum CHAB5714 TaxID=2780399 RepID=A0ABS8I7W1_9NOSO|nr:hypothetical protein [Nostoc favosum]MCC5599899.1 hypothetical protein [Nostoc favosum CHAB5714]
MAASVEHGLNNSAFIPPLESGDRLTRHEFELLGKWDIQTYPVKSIKRVRLLRKADGYYCQFCIDVDVQSESRIADGELGLDVGLEYFYSDSNGRHEESPNFPSK